jgi:hypothetical protein
MNNIISKVAASILLAGITISGVNAASTLVIDGNVSTAQTDSFYVDMSTVSAEANLTFIPKVNATPGSGFTLKFENGGYLEEYSQIFLCATADGNESDISDNNLTIVGNMFSQGQRGTIIDGAMTAPQFQFKNDANESLIDAKTHIYFRTDNKCTKLPKIKGINGSCLSVTAQIVDGVTTQGTSYPDYDTAAMTLGKTAKAIKIACSVPVCQIDVGADMKEFTTDPKPAGINKIVEDITVNEVTASDNTGKISACPECDQVNNCITKIEISNATSTPIEAIKFALNFYNEKGEVANDSLKLKDVTISLDNNKTVGYTINGSAVKLTGIDLNSTDGNATINVTYTPNETDVIPAGLVKARVYDLDTNTSKAGIDVKYDEVKDFAVFKLAGQTEFVVPYMNMNYKTFVKITSQVNDNMKLSAVITDQDGKSTEVALDDLGAKKTVYLFSTFGPLYDAAKAAGLNNAWTVKFTTSGSVTVDAYMKSPNGGDRRIEAFGN